MRTSFRIRSLLFAAPLLVAAAVWALPAAEVETAMPAVTTAAAVESPAEAVPTAINNCTYYNNANHSKVVGQFGYDCCNNPVAWGKKTQYSECGGCFPCFPPPR